MVQSLLLATFAGKLILQRILCAHVFKRQLKSFLFEKYCSNYIF